MTIFRFKSQELSYKQLIGNIYLIYLRNVQKCELGKVLGTTKFNIRYVKDNGDIVKHAKNEICVLDRKHYEHISLLLQYDGELWNDIIQYLDKNVLKFKD